MKPLKVIETWYKGYRFRSRLEARWAVFFDAMGIKWEYETEGFDLGGLWYLPDFWMSDWNVYVEIKPSDVTHEEAKKPAYLVRDSGREVILLAGQPYPDEYIARRFLLEKTWEAIKGSRVEGDEKVFATCNGRLTLCPGCGVVCHLSQTGRKLVFRPLGKPEKQCQFGDGHAVSCEVFPDLMTAFRLAREARFEFDETPISMSVELNRAINQTIKSFLKDRKHWL